MKTRIKNLGRIEQPFVVGQNDGVPIVDVVLPGETKDVDVKHGKNNKRVQALRHAGVIELPDEGPKAGQRAKDAAG